MNSLIMQESPGSRRVFKYLGLGSLSCLYALVSWLAKRRAYLFHLISEPSGGSLCCLLAWFSDRNRTEKGWVHDLTLIPGRILKRVSKHLGQRETSRCLWMIIKHFFSVVRKTILDGTRMKFGIVLLMCDTSTISITQNLCLYRYYRIRIR